MRQNKKIAFISFLFFLAILIIQFNSFGQNILVVHKKNGKRNFTLKEGKKVKIVTLNNQIIKGRIIRIKDSTIVISKKSEAIEVVLKDIQLISLNGTALLKYSSGVLMGLISIGFVTSIQDDPPNDILGGVLCIPPTLLLLIKWNRYNISKYDFIIIKPKSRI
jgi:hypothetical protein